MFRQRAQPDAAAGSADAGRTTASRNASWADATAAICNFSFVPKSVAMPLLLSPRSVAGLPMLRPPRPSIVIVAGPAMRADLGTSDGELHSSAACWSASTCHSSIFTLLTAAVTTALVYLLPQTRPTLTIPKP